MREDLHRFLHVLQEHKCYAYQRRKLLLKKVVSIRTLVCSKRKETSKTFKLYL